MVQRFTMPVLEVAEVQGKVLASVVFGQSSLGCRGNGICRVDMVTMEQFQTLGYDNLAFTATTMCYKVPVSFKYDNIEGLTLNCYRSTIPLSVYKKQFDQSFFRLGEDFCLPEWLQEELDYRPGFIKKGDYQLIKEFHTISVRFKFQIN